jgi:L-asparaginase II
MMNDGVVALFQLTRGKVVESTHYGAIAVADADGRLLYSCGDPYAVAFLRSAAKPFQALPFFESSGPKTLGLSGPERALICSSHEGSERHVRIVCSIQEKAGIEERDLQCGVHMPGDAAAYKSLVALGNAPSPNHNNCSGKHSAMLALAKTRNLPLESYLDLNHPVQQDILSAMSEMSSHPRDKVQPCRCRAPPRPTPGFAIRADWRVDAGARLATSRRR